MTNKQENDDDAVFERAVIRFGEISKSEYSNRTLSLSDRIYHFVAGGQYERWVTNGAADLGTDDKGQHPRIETNIMGAAIRIACDSLTKNMPNITFSDDTAEGSLSETANILTDRFRYDFKRVESYQATMAAFKDALVGGYSAISIDIVSKSENNKEIQFGFIPDADANVFFDVSLGESTINAKRCWVLRRVSSALFEELYPDDFLLFKTTKASQASSWQSPITREYLKFWLEDKNDSIVIADYYERRTVRAKYEVYEDQTGIETKEFISKELDADKIDSLLSAGYRRISSKYKEKSELHKYTMSGAGMLEHTKLAGDYIPIVELYAEKFIVDGNVGYRGIVRGVKDLADTVNFAMSSILRVAAISPVQAAVIPAAAIAGFENEWNTINQTNSAYLRCNILQDSSGNVIWSPANLGQVPSPSTPSSLLDLLNAANGLIDKQLSYDSLKTKVNTSASGVALNVQENNIEEGTMQYIDNFAVCLQRIAAIWLNLVPSVYINQSNLKTLNENGEYKFDKVNISSLDGILNDMSFDENSISISCIIGPTPQSRRSTVVAKLLAVIPLADPQTQKILLLKLIQNLEGSGLDSLTEYARKQLVNMQVDEPKEGEQPAKQEPSAIDQYTAASTEKIISDIEIKRAKTISEIRAEDAKTEQLLLQSAEMVAENKKIQNDLISLVELVRQIIPESNNVQSADVQVPKENDIRQELSDTGEGGSILKNPAENLDINKQLNIQPNPVGNTPTSQLDSQTGRQ